jgi:transposase
LGMKRYVVRLSAEEREGLAGLVRKGTVAARKRMHAQVLLQADESERGPGWTDARIAEGLGIGVRTVESIRERLVEEGLEAALNRKKQSRPSRERLLDGEKEAKLIAISCGEPPAGRERWTLRLLADRLVELRVVESISHETVRQAMGKKRAEAVA